MNVLVIINYNSDREVTNLIEKSNFASLNITEVIVHCNGSISDVVQRQRWEKQVTRKNVKLKVNSAENKGYGVSINYWLENDLNVDYIFFCNADLWIENNPYSKYRYETDLVGFGLWQNKKLLLTKINYLTPLIPVRVRRALRLSTEFGQSKAVHGGFIGVRQDFVRKSNIRFNDIYFLYWDELWFCEEASNKYKASIGVSDQIIINHDGEKAGKTEDTRYYMLRNGLHFYLQKKRCVVCALALLVMNFILAALLRAREGTRQAWFKDSIYDFYKKNFGKRM